MAECAAAMLAAAGAVPVTVKCRIGVDEQDPEEVLPAFLGTIAAAGVTRVAIHARKAWLQGLSPKENREIPPLDHGLVLRMRARFPDLAIAVNGGIESLAQAADFLDRGLDGVMIGRAAYHAPAILGAADRMIFGAPGPDVAAEEAVAGDAPLHRGRKVARHAAQRDHPAHARRLPGPARRPRLAAAAVGGRASAGRRAGAGARGAGRGRAGACREPVDPVRRAG